ncbi:MAG TPA: Vms1/Ankzf1 family peptidyl-tRNA hydrolase [Thermoanaerobaculia bacterium]|nr:Vms1/Ankzf1 family peptidyl-tRNA hydrolase [Thermoanaerobaculia bacterium]
MFNNIDLRELAGVSGPERAFVSLYLSTPDSLAGLKPRIEKIRALLADNLVETEYFDENMKIVEQWLAEHTWTTDGACLFVCWALDFVRAYPLTVPGPDFIWVDSSPYIRPLAELQDEYENFVIVAADNSASRVFFVTSNMADQDARIKGDVKNNVKKGGWSQKRYERRRNNELMHYSKEIVDVLTEMDQKETFARLFLVGSQETMTEIEGALPAPLAAKLAGTKPVDFSAGDDQIFDASFDMFFAAEREAEAQLWEKIKGEYCRGGLAVTGAEDVLKAAAVGRVEKMAVTRDARIAGTRCRDCENLLAGEMTKCKVCGSADVFKVDLVNELVELLALSSAETDFVDPIEGLTNAGDVAALLRY